MLRRKGWIARAPDRVKSFFLLLVGSRVRMGVGANEGRGVHPGVASAVLILFYSPEVDCGVGFRELAPRLRQLLGKPLRVATWWPPNQVFG